MVQVLASLNHSNIAPIYGLEELDRAILLAVKSGGNTLKIFRGVRVGESFVSEIVEPSDGSRCSR